MPCAPGKLRNCEKPTKGRIQDGGRRPNFQCTSPDISGTAKARDFKFGVCIDYER